MAEALAAAEAASAVIGLVQLVADVARTIYDIVQTVKANKSRCINISRRCTLFAGELSRLPPRKPQLQSGLVIEVLNALESVKELVTKFADANVVIRIIRCGSYAEKFDEINDRLSRCWVELGVSLAIDLRAEELYDPKKERELEKEDDRQMIQMLMNVSSDVVEVKTMVSEVLDIVRCERGISSAMHERGQDADLPPSVARALLEHRNTVTEHGSEAQSPTDASSEDENDLGSKWEIDYDALKFDIRRGMKVELGRGGFGSVFSATYRGQPVAVKEVAAKLDPKLMRSFKHEMDVVYPLSHPNVISVVGGCSQRYVDPEDTSAGVESCAVIVMERMEKSLNELLHAEKESMTIDQKIDILHQLARALTYLSGCKSPIYHRDIKPGNILWQDGSIRLTDFGMAKVKDETVKQDSSTIAGAGTARYMAPERMHSINRDDSKVDIFSFGMIIWELMTGIIPYPHADSISQVLKDLTEGSWQPQFPSSVPEHITNLAQQCLRRDPRERPSCTQLMVYLEMMKGGLPLSKNIISPLQDHDVLPLGIERVFSDVGEVMFHNRVVEKTFPTLPSHWPKGALPPCFIVSGEKFSFRYEKTPYTHPLFQSVKSTLVKIFGPTEDGERCIFTIQSYHIDGSGLYQSAIRCIKSEIARTCPFLKTDVVVFSGDRSPEEIEALVGDDIVQSRMVSKYNDRKFDIIRQKADFLFRRRYIYVCTPDQLVGSQQELQPPATVTYTNTDMSALMGMSNSSVGIPERAPGSMSGRKGSRDEMFGSMGGMPTLGGGFGEGLSSAIRMDSMGGGQPQHYQTHTNAQTMPGRRNFASLYAYQRDLVETHSLTAANSKIPVSASLIVGEIALSGNVNIEEEMDFVRNGNLKFTVPDYMWGKKVTLNVPLLRVFERGVRKQKGHHVGEINVTNDQVT